MFPKIGPLNSYGLMMAIGFWAAWLAALHRARKENIDGKHISDMLIVAMISGVMGARILYIIQFNDRFASFWDFFKIWQGGLVFYGGMVAATVALVIFIYLRKLPLPKIADVAGPPVALGLVFGRIGCFLFGCCYGRVAENLFFAVRFPPGSPASNTYAGGVEASPPIIPTQLISSFDNLLVFLAATFFFRYRHRYGESFLVFAMLYGVHRFLVEILRGDSARPLLNMSMSQSLSLVLVIIALALFVRSRLLPGNIEAAPAAASNPAAASKGKKRSRGKASR